MGFFSQAGKRKKKDKDRKGMFQAEELEQESMEWNESEKTMFLTPEERYGSEAEHSNKASEEEEETPDYSNKKLFRGDPIIINGPDYLLRINETRMEALLTLYRRFSREEIQRLLKENGVIFGVQEKTVEELAQGTQNYEEIIVAIGVAPRDGRDGYFEYHFNPEPETKPIILPDDTVDYNVLGKIELVKKGQLLVTYHAALPAVKGRD
ncbi:MAG: FapA family protein, partial [Lachnospiraceae bacterium]|nr:FapA family protein [Lachnospiraceae bacterium]